MMKRSFRAMPRESSGQDLRLKPQLLTSIPLPIRLHDHIL